MNNDILKASEIVRQAGDLIGRKGFSVSQKGNNSNFVTDIDKAVEEFLAQKLTCLISGSEILGEETSHSIPKASDIWVVDPIDGTSNFIRDIGFSGISVGLVRDGKPYAGIIYNPYRDEMYIAETGYGATLNGQQIKVSDRDFSHAHLCSAMSLYDKRYAPACFLIIEEIYMQSDDLRRMGTASLELAMLAAGRTELYFEMRLFPWDAAAGLVLIREAGGIAECLHYDNLPLDRPFPVIAANRCDSFERLKEIVCRHIPEVPYDERIF